MRLLHELFKIYSSLFHVSEDSSVIIIYNTFLPMYNNSCVCFFSKYTLASLWLRRYRSDVDINEVLWSPLPSSLSLGSRPVATWNGCTLYSLSVVCAGHFSGPRQTTMADRLCLAILVNTVTVDTSQTPPVYHTPCLSFPLVALSIPHFSGILCIDMHLNIVTLTGSWIWELEDFNSLKENQLIFDPSHLKVYEST